MVFQLYYWNEGLFIPMISFNICSYLLNIGVFYHISLVAIL